MWIPYSLVFLLAVSFFCIQSIGVAYQFPPIEKLHDKGMMDHLPPASHGLKVPVPPLYDYYLLVLQYANNVCQVKSCLASYEGKRLKKFTVHGLWPQKFRGKADCPDADIDLECKAIIKYREDLRKFWPNILDGQSEGTFWSMQWKKHGGCSQAALPDQSAYYDFALKAAKLVLQDIDTIKGNDKSSTSEIIKEQVFQRTNAYPAIRCSKIKIKGKEEYILTELAFCLRKTEEPVLGNCTTIPVQDQCEEFIF